MPEIAAIISAYYCEEWLHRRVRNLLSTPQVSEIIAVCKLDSIEYRILQNYPTLRIITTKDIPTLYKAWNLAIMAAKSPLITNANSDDLFTPNGLQILHIGLSEGKFDYFAGSFYKELPGGQRKYFSANRSKMVDAFFTLWKRDLGLYDESFKICGDWDFQLRIAGEGKRIGWTSLVTGIAWGGGISSEKNRKLWLAEDRIIRKKYNL